MVRISVNQGAIKRNKSNKDQKLPVIAVEEGGEVDFCHELIIYGTNNEIAARVVYDPSRPLKNQATVWVEAYNRVDLISKEDKNGS